MVGMLCGLMSTLNQYGLSAEFVMTVVFHRGGTEDTGGVDGDGHR